MELKEINEDYTRAKSKLTKLEPLKAEIETLKKEQKEVIRQIEDLKKAKTRAEEDKDTKKAKQIEEDLKAPTKRLKLIKEDLEEKASRLENAQKKVDSKIEELSNNPALKEHLNTIIGKKFSRQILAKDAKKETLEKQSEEYQKIKAAAAKDPYVKNTLKGIEGYTAIIESLKNSKNPDDIKKVNEAKLKLKDRRNDLKTYFKGSISEETIATLTSLKNIDSQIKSNTREIKSLNKQITNYENALEEIGFVSPRKISNIEKSDPNIADTRTGSGEGKEPNDSNLPTTQPKWYQFIKRFKNWYNKRVYEEEPQGKIPGKEKDTEFRTAMKYDIIKDYEAKLEQDLLKQAKSKRKEKVSQDKQEETIEEER